MPFLMQNTAINTGQTVQVNFSKALSFKNLN